MARVKGAMMTRKRRNKILKMAKGYWGAKSKHFKMANQQVMKSLTYAYTGLLLRTHLQAIFTGLLASLAVLAGRISPAGNGAFVGIAALAL